MTNEFLAWFALYIGERPFFSEEEKEELKLTHGLHGGILVAH